MKCVVIDAGILLSALTGHSEAPPAMLLNAMYDRIVEAVACPYLIEEVRDNLSRNPYFSSRIDDKEAHRAIARIERAITMLADPIISPEPLIRDPEDDYLVALARIADAEFIVTGDNDLLEHIGLEPPAINARNACELLGLLELR